MVILSEDGVDDDDVVNGDDSNQSSFGGAGLFFVSIIIMIKNENEMMMMMLVKNYEYDEFPIQSCFDEAAYWLFTLRQPDPGFASQ